MEQIIQASFREARDVQNVPAEWIEQRLERAILKNLRPLLASGRPFTVYGQLSGKTHEPNGDTTHFRAVAVLPG